MVDVSDGARELVGMSAEAVNMLGQHLDQIGDLIDGSKITASAKGVPTAAQKIRFKLEQFEKYQEDKLIERKEAEERHEADRMRMADWRKYADGAGQSLLEKLQSYMDKCDLLEQKLEKEGMKLVREKEKVRNALVVVQKKEQKLVRPCQKIIKLEEEYTDNSFMRAVMSCWVQNTFDEVRFQFRAAQEKEKLRIENHQKMRKARAQARVDVIQRVRDQRLLEACFLRFQEEEIEGRHKRQLDEMRQAFEDRCLVMEAQLAQALGDEESAKNLIEEQARRMEAMREEVKETNRLRKLAEREMRAAKEEAAHMRDERDEALSAKAQAEAERDAALEAMRDAQDEAAAANLRAEKADAMRKTAEEERDQAESDLKRKLKKIDSLQRMLAELGAESDSDCPPDERPPPFFVNDDGTRAPRPRTRKERMAMAYREAEVARWELRLGLAVMIDKDINTGNAMDRLKFELRLTERECDEVRWANKVLIQDVNSIQNQLRNSKRQPPSEIAVQTSPEDGGVYAPLTGIPLAPSSVGLSQFDPSRPHFTPHKDKPNLLVKTPSAPIFMPSLSGDTDLLKGFASEKITLAPLRRKKRPPTQWQVSWH